MCLIVYARCAPTPCTRLLWRLKFLRCRLIDLDSQNITNFLQITFLTARTVEVTPRVYHTLYILVLQILFLVLWWVIINYFQAQSQPRTGKASKISI
jgi:hypothetical protein